MTLALFVTVNVFTPSVLEKVTNPAVPAFTVKVSVAISETAPPNVMFAPLLASPAFVVSNTTLFAKDTVPVEIEKAPAVVV